MYNLSCISPGVSWLIATAAAQSIILLYAPPTCETIDSQLHADRNAGTDSTIMEEPEIFFLTKIVAVLE